MNPFEFSADRVSEVRRIEIAHEHATQWDDEYWKCECCWTWPCTCVKHEEGNNGR